MNTAQRFKTVCLTILTILMIVMMAPAKAQTYTKAKVIGSDTVIKAGLPVYTVVADRHFDSDNVKDAYYKTVVLRRDIERVKPYAKDVSKVFAEISADLAQIEKKKDRKAYIKQKEAMIQLKFEARIQTLTKQQAEIFVKLIHRESGRTVHEWLQDIKGKTSAFYWQNLAKTVGANLKSTYDAKGMDKEIERIYTNSYR